MVPFNEVRKLLRPRSRKVVTWVNLGKRAIHRAKPASTE